MIIRSKASWIVTSVWILFMATTTMAQPPAPHWQQWNWDATTTLSDLSWLNDPPAGKHGFVQVNGDQFQFSDGRKIRFWGITLSAAACFPDKEDAAPLAARLAGLGFNMVRLHHMDAPWAARGLIDYSRDDSRHFDHQNWQRLDYFIQELKKVGIYIFLDLLVSRQFKDGDGVSNAATLPHQGKGATIIDPWLIELQQEYAAALWNHLNPFSGLRYKDDPAFALTLITNENDLTSHFFLLPDHTPHHPLLSQYYLQLLDGYARSHNQSRVKTRRVWQSSEGRRATTALMIRYFRTMHSFLRHLGVKIPISGSNWATNLHDLPALASMDFMDQHIYAEGQVESADFVSDPNHRSTSLQRLAFAGVAGKPLFISEWNKNYPSRYRGEYPLWFAAIAAFQDWNGALIYAYSHDNWINDYLHHPYDVAIDPARLSLLPAAAIIYRRAVHKAAHKGVIQLTSDQIYHNSVPPSSILALRAGLSQQQLRLSWQPQPQSILPSQRFISHSATTSTSDDGQLHWDWQQGIRRIDTPQLQAIIGWGRATQHDTSATSIQLDNDFIAVALCSLAADDTPIERAERLLLSIATQARNSASTPLSNGSSPIMVERPQGRICFRHENSSLNYRALLPNGQWQKLGQLQRSPTGWFELQLPPKKGVLLYEFYRPTVAKDSSTASI